MNAMPLPGTTPLGSKDVGRAVHNAHKGGGRTLSSGRKKPKNNWVGGHEGLKGIAPDKRPENKENW